MHTFLLKIIFTSLVNLASLSAEINESHVKIIEHIPLEQLVTNCSKISLNCLITSSSLSNVYVWWTFNNDNVSKLGSSQINQIAPNQWQLSLDCATLTHSGSYTCHAIIQNETQKYDKKETFVKVHVPIDIHLTNENKLIRKFIGDNFEIKCIVKAFPKAEIEWFQWKNDDQNSTKLTNIISNDKHNIINVELNDTFQQSSLIINELSQGDNGTYLCQTQNEFSKTEKAFQLIVIQSLEIAIDHVQALNSHNAQLNWIVISDGDSPIENITLITDDYSASNNDFDLMVINKPAKSGYFIVENLVPAAIYGFELRAINKESYSSISSLNFTMPSEVPGQITEQHVIDTTNETVLVGWKRPIDNGAQIADYRLELVNIKSLLITPEVINIKNSSQIHRKNFMYIFVGLESATEYSFHVKACSLQGCGNWSDSIKAKTKDGHAEPPKNVQLTCYFDTSKNINYGLVTWNHTENPRGTLVGYNITFFGVAKYRNSENQFVHDYFSESYLIKNNHSNELGSIPLTANTNYTVSICAINLVGCGFFSELQTDKNRCSLPPSVPQNLPDFRLQQSKTFGQLQLYFPKISERLGLILCYRLFLIKMPKNMSVKDLPLDKTLLNVTSYTHVHQSEDESRIGVYIADEVNGEQFNNDMIIGDGQVTNCDYEANLNRKENKDSPKVWEKRVKNNNVYSMKTKQTIEDGPLSEQTNYSGFVEIEVLGSNGVILHKTSNYLFPQQFFSPSQLPNTTNTISPLLSSIANPTSTIIILCIISAFALFFILLIILFVLLIRRSIGAPQRDVHESDHVYKNKKANNYIKKANGYLPAKQISGSFSKFHVPIHVSDLLNVYKERHSNNNSLFEVEFNSLPLDFQDRTTQTCDLNENREKNRFDSIKCYDLTRVRLSLIDYLQLNPSDYIHANFISFNEKLYICTQCPLESTISDFWRMIYEYECCVIVMVTNCENQSKTKCAHYWSDEGYKTINSSISVQIKSIKVYTDFLVRRFNLIVNNKNQNLREIVHFQYTKWFDDTKPEIPSRILKFIKYVNENYCQDKGPLVVHCCSGVGRSATYIAIDSILSEINTGFVNIYERVSNLRHQRHYMVENPVQYIFIYRSILEFAIFGDTEVDIDHFNDYYSQIFELQKDNILNDQFNRLKVGIGDQKDTEFMIKQENMSKNKSNHVVPNDHNKVSINSNQNEDIKASFIKSYDTQLSFIVLQDPTEATVNEFWSIIYEHDVSQIIMLSHVDSKQKFFRYWPTDEIILRNFSVKLVEESNFTNYFIKRRIQLSKQMPSSESPHSVILYQFLAWHSDHIIPESAIPLIVLCEQVISYKDLNKPILLHCFDGAQRSSVCLGLMSLIYQIKIDKKIDIFQTARCIALQKRGMFKCLDQFAFLYRSTMNYIKHRNLCDTSDVVL